MAGALSALAEAGIIRPYPVELIAPVPLAVLAEVSRATAGTPGMKHYAADLVSVLLQYLQKKA